MKKNFLITVYITNRNYGNFIKKAIDSVLNQSYSNLEIVIIDDASTDNSINILKNYRNIKNIKIIFNKAKKGLVKSSLIAIKASRGRYILRLDADDYLNTHALKYMFNKIKNKPDVALVFPDFFNVCKNSNFISRFRYTHKKKYNFLDMPAHGDCSLINKKIFFKIGGYNKLFDRQDGFYIWLLILLNKFKIIHCQKPLFYYRKHDNNLSKNTKKILKTRLKILQFFLKNKENHISPLKKLKQKTILKLKNIK